MLPAVTAALRSRARRQVTQVLHDHPALWRGARELRSRVLQRLPPVDVPNHGPFHRNDFMLRSYGSSPEGITAYLASARATVDAVTRLARKAGADVDGGRWLEIGAGYGRLLRVLTERVPRERITAVELDPAARRFSSDTLGFRVLPSDAHFNADPGGDFAVVFAISVITHVNWDASRRFLQLGLRELAPGGAFVFSTHGQRALDELEANNPGSFGGVRAELEDAWSTAGFYYSPYRFTKGEYGMTWHRPDVVEQLVAEVDPTAEVVAHEPHGLLDYQDLWVVRRPATR